MMTLALLCALALSPTLQGPSEAEEPEEPVETGHERMVRQLGNVARKAELLNPNLISEDIPGYLEELAELPENEKLRRRWELNRMLGMEAIRSGREAEALEYMNAAYELMDRMHKPLRQRERAATAFELGVAYMRWGETLNCCKRHTSDSCIFPIQGEGVHVELEGSQQAIYYYTETMRLSRPSSRLYVRARWVLNICYMTLGRWPDDVPDEYLIPPETFESTADFPRFLDIAPELELNSFDHAGGAVVDDFDGDGYLDVLSSSSDTSDQLRFWHNNADGSFTEQTDEANLTGLLGGLNMVDADYDNDGDLDVLVLRGGWWRQRVRHPNSLLRNNGDGTFTDVTFEAGLGEVHYPTQTGDWADYDNDGDVDLYVGNEFGESSPLPCQLFRNEGDGTFVDVAEEAGVLNGGFCKSVHWGDYNNDRYPDLFASNMGGPNKLYENLGNGAFREVGHRAGVVDPVSSFVSWWWDVDNDGNLDLFSTAYGGKTIEPDVADVALSYLGLPHMAELPHLYKGDGKGHFTNVAEEWGLGRVTLVMGSNFGDVDGDGWTDMYLGTGYPFYEALMPNVMYRNDAGKGFVDVTTAGGFGHLQKGHSVSFADVDEDGDQDVYQQMGGTFPGDAFGNALFENPGFGNHWLKVRCVGTTTNRAAIGVRIRADIVEDGTPRSIYRWVGSGGSFGCNPLRQELGLGRAERVERLEIYWPTSDTTQVFEDVAADQAIEVTEGEEAFEVTTLAPFTFATDG
jgi:hypothetical protein